MNKLIKNTVYEVLTPNGFVPFDSLRKTKNKLIQFTLNSGKTIKVTPKHRFTVDNIDVFAEDLYVGDRLDTLDGLEYIDDIQYINNIETVYDLMNVDNGSTYYTNNIVSHNSFLSSKTPKLISEKLLQKFRMFLDEHEGFGKDITLDMYESKEFKIRIYHKFREDRTYLISVDVGEGVGKDFSVCYVWDVTDMTNIIMCAKFSDNTIATNEFAYVISRIYRMYGQAWLAIESNSIGKSVIDLLIQLYNCENHVMMNKGGPGIFSHAQSKSKACRFVKNLLGNPDVNVNLYDDALIDEMDFFVQKNTAKHILFNAIPGKHDDHIMTFIWGLYVLNEKDISNYFSIMQFMKTAIGETLPLYLSSLINPINPNIDTSNLLDLEWRKQKEEVNKYIQIKLKTQKPNKLDYFDKKPRATGVLGMMEREELLEDYGISRNNTNSQLIGYFGGMNEEW